MPKYRFAVRSKEGKLRTGTVTEASLDTAKERLQQAGFAIVSLTEESELVIHQASPSVGGGTTATHKTERAAILEFETTAWEKVSDFFSRWVFRKEVAFVLFLCGFALAGYRVFTRPAKTGPVEPQYVEYTVTVEIEPGKAEGEEFVVLLPEIPLRMTQKVSIGKSITSEFETLKKPDKVEVTLVDLHQEVVAKGEGLLSLKDEKQLVSTVTLDPVKPASEKKKPVKTKRK